MFSWWRARKKKVLINLPFVNRTIRKVPDTPKAPLKNPIATKKPLQTEVVKEDAVPLKKPTQNTNEPKKPAQLLNINKIVLSNSVSINSKTFGKEQEKSKEEEVDITNRPTKAYTHEEFLNKWKSYKEILLKKGKANLATVFEYQPQINNDTIELLVENRALEEEFNHYKPDFIEHIRSSLQNYNIQVTTKINKEFKTKKAYTPQEKYEKMIEKNPTLELLKKKLNMEVGYS